MVEVNTIRVAIAAAGPTSPLSSRFNIATEASVVSGEYRNTAAEIVVIEEFLPKALDEAGLRVLVKEAIAEVAAASGKAPTPKEIGVVIKAVQAKLQAAGLRAEGRIVSETVKRELAG